MQGFEQLSEIIKQAVRSERALADLYDVAKLGLKRPESREVVTVLSKDHGERLAILENLNVADFGHPEWVKYPPAMDTENIVPKRKLTRETPPEEVLKAILLFQERHEAFYKVLMDKVTAPGLKELLASLVTFKHNQADDVRRLMAEDAPVGG